MSRRTAIVVVICSVLFFGVIVIVAVASNSGPNPRAVSCNLALGVPSVNPTDDDAVAQGQMVPAGYVQATARPAPRRTSGAGSTQGPTSTGGTKPTTGTSGGAQPKGPNAVQQNVPTPPAGQQKRAIKGEKAYTPPKGDVPQPQADIDAVDRQIPSNGNFRLSRTQGYESPVTHHIYVFHDEAYFAHLGWHDPYDPYDPYNWSYHPGWDSPFGPSHVHGAHFVVVDRC